MPVEIRFLEARDSPPIKVCARCGLEPADVRRYKREGSEYRCVSYGRTHDRHWWVWWGTKGYELVQG